MSSLFSPPTIKRTRLSTNDDINNNIPDNNNNNTSTTTINDSLITQTEQHVRDATHILESNVDDIEIQLAIADLRLALAMQPMAKKQLESLRETLDQFNQLQKYVISMTMKV
jgi:hypothetical protein